MIKLKNLWKIALATMAMSAMLVACDTESSDSEEKNMAKYKTNPVMAKADSFTYGFKFTTEEGWAAQFICANATTEKVFDKTYVKVGGSANMKTEAGSNKNEAGVEYSDDSTKLFIDSGELVPAKMYTLTYEKKTGKVSLAAAADDAKATSTTAQKADADGVFPAGIYISGYLGSNWAADDNAADALLMDVVDAANEVYSFTWVAPAATVTVTLKITMADTNSTLYLKDVPVKVDGTSVIDGSIYSWNSGTAVTIKNEDGSVITGGIFDAAATAASNAEWALNNYLNGNKKENVDLAKNFRMEGADDVLQLSINAEKWVSYVKGKESVFSWNNAQDKLEAPAAE